MDPAPALINHPSSMEHDTGRHPEQAARIMAIAQTLSEADWCGYERIASPPCPEEILRAVHPGRYVTHIRELAEAGGGRIDADTVVSAGSFEAALHAAGGAVDLVERVVSGRAPTGFSIHRPPGHHAEPGRAMGFCLFNNIAVAATHALQALGLERVMIVDYDVHHGNGTNTTFHADPRVLYVSVHQSPLYPGTGPLTDVGSGDGEGFCVNLPVTAGSGDTVFCGLIDGVAVPLAQAFAPQLLLVSAGFDAGVADPLADCQVSDAGFAAMTSALRDVGAAVGAPVAAVLEGGYALAALGGSVAAAMSALAGPAQPLDASAPLSLEARDARDRLARWWPALAAAAS